MKRTGSALGPAVLVLSLLAVPLPAVAQAMDGSGLVATGLMLRQMDGVKRVLMIGAHPDDEDTSLLATLARAHGAETAYLSLTRGDGGQNLIGPELFEGLGVIRTGELEAARRLDGGRQFFTRAFDYGYSKTAEEALRLWPRDELLHDVVWVVRSFRPHVIVSVFSGTPRDGHGQHQAAGIMAREAFAAAGDRSRFPEQLERGVEAWAPPVLYQSSRRFFGGGGGPAEEPLSLETGRFDPLLGRSHFQLAMESRSQHRSQDMGAPQPPGPSETAVILVDSRVQGAGQGGFFAGIDTTLAGLAAGLAGQGRAEVTAHLAAYRASVAAARERFALDGNATARALGEALMHLRQASRAAGSGAGTELTRALAAKERLAEQAYLAASGIVLLARAQDDLVVPGQEVELRVQLWNGSGRALPAARAGVETPSEWSAVETAREGVADDGTVAPGTLATWTYAVRVPADAGTSLPYFLERERDGAWYRWPDEHALWGLPRDPAPVRASVAFDGGPAGRIQATEPWRYAGVDPARGEFHKPVLTVPALSVRVTPSGMAWPSGRTAPRSVQVAVRSEVPEASGWVRLDAPDGWSVTPTQHDLELSGAGAERTVTFQVAPRGALPTGEHTFAAVVRSDDGTIHDESVSLIDYEHIERTVMLAPAEARVTVVPVRVADGLRVGYIMGSGDDGPEAIRQMGAEVVELDRDAVLDGAYAGLDAVVLGVRAFETRADLQAAAGQLRDFASAGGTVVVQYNRGPLEGLAPHPLRVGRGSPRVSDETAPVRILDPNAPVFAVPNRITAADFEGWVQERGLYFASEWDAAYRPLIELHDPGEEPRRGALLVSPVGDGVFVYAALSFFRQWSARVPGAYRLFANLVSLEGSAWASFAAGSGSSP